MTVARILTVNAASLGVLGGSFVEVTYRRAANNDSFTITPQFKRNATLVSNIAEVELIATTAGSICEIGIFTTTGSQLFKCFFAMPDEDSNLHELDLYTAWPVGGNNGGLGAAIWGRITGTLSNQADLWGVLQGKQATIVAGTIAQYWRGDKTWQDLTIGAVAGLQTLIDGLIDTIAGKEPAITAGTEGQFFSWDKSFRTITIDLVSGLTAALNGKEPTIAAGIAAQYWRGDKTWQTLNIDAIPNLQTTLNGKEPSITAGTTTQYYRGDKTWQTLNIAAVENLQTTLSEKIEDIQSPAATGETLVMTKSTVYARLKKLIAAGDISITSAADLITIGLTGSTLKYWTETVGSISSKFWRSFKPNRQGAEANTTAIDAFLSGLHASGQATSNDSHYYAVTFADPAGTFGGISLGRGALDLQVYRTATANCASATYAVALGANNLVSGANSIAISAQKTLSQVTGANSIFIGEQGTVSGQFNTVIGQAVSGLITVSGNRNVAVGSAGTTGDNYLLLGSAARTFAGGHSIIICSSQTQYNTIDDRNIKGVYVWSCSRKVNQNNIAQQFYAIGLMGSTPNTNTGVWVTTTTADLLAGEGVTTTNTYKLPTAGGDIVVCFYGFARVSSNLGLKIFKVEGRCYGASQTLDFTVSDFGGTTSNPNHGTVQVVKSSQQLYLQFKVDEAIAVLSSIDCRAMLYFTELGT